LAASVALAPDLAVLNGSGSAGQPTGIIGTSGVGSTTATTVDYGKVLDFQSDIAAANVMPVAGGYVTTSAVSKILMTKQRFSSTDTPLWDGTMWDGRMAGFRAMSSEQIPSGHMIFGDWTKVVVGEWGVLEDNVNTFANFQAGIIGVRAMYTMDVGVRYAGAFSVSTSVTA
jgi:HK97 family phage major capsid protein